MRFGGVFSNVLFFGAVYCFGSGINSILTSIMPFALRDRINPGFLAGLLNSAGYVGSMASSYGLGLIADRAGWDTVMVLLLFVSVGASVLAWGAVLATYLHGRKHSPKPDEGP